jgi:hypothetical protein
MKFHQWPNTYNWTQIGLNPSSDNSSAQKMITDVRNACDAKYNDEGTSTTISNVSSALDKNFNYSTSNKQLLWIFRTIKDCERNPSK